MDSRLKQRLIGAAVLVALAVIFLPMLVQGPAPDSGISSVPLSMPDTPDAGTVTRDLPLVSPGEAPDGGAVGMDSRVVAPAVAANDAANPASAGADADAMAPPATPSAATAHDVSGTHRWWRLRGEFRRVWHAGGCRQDRRVVACVAVAGLSRTDHQR